MTKFCIVPWYQSSIYDIVGNAAGCVYSVSFACLCVVRGAQRSVSRDRVCSYIVPPFPPSSPPCSVCWWKVILLVFESMSQPPSPFLCVEFLWFQNIRVDERAVIRERLQLVSRWLLLYASLYARLVQYVSDEYAFHASLTVGSGSYSAGVYSPFYV